MLVNDYIISVKDLVGGVLDFCNYIPYLNYSLFSIQDIYYDIRSRTSYNCGLLLNFSMELRLYSILQKKKRTIFIVWSCLLYLFILDKNVTIAREFGRILCFYFDEYGAPDNLMWVTIMS